MYREGFITISCVSVARNVLLILSSTQKTHTQSLQQAIYIQCIIKTLSVRLNSKYIYIFDCFFFSTILLEWTSHVYMATTLETAMSPSIDTESTISAIIRWLKVAIRLPLTKTSKCEGWRLITRTKLEPGCSCLPWLILCSVPQLPIHVFMTTIRLPPSYLGLKWNTTVGCGCVWQPCCKFTWNLGGW